MRRPAGAARFFVYPSPGDLQGLGLAESGQKDNLRGDLFKPLEIVGMIKSSHTPQAGEVETAPQFIIFISEHLQNRGKMEKGGSPFLLDQFQRQLRIKAVDDDVLPPGLQGGHGQRQPGNVKEGQYANMAVLRPKAVAMHHFRADTDEIPLAQQGPSGSAGHRRPCE